MITSGGLGTMGFGLPAAIGAKVARPDALVIDIGKVPKLPILCLLSAYSLI